MRLRARGRDPPDAPERLGEQAQRFGLTVAVADAPPDRERLLELRNRRVVAVGDRALVAGTLAQLGLVLGPQPSREAHSAVIQGRAFAVRAKRGRAFGGGRCVAEHGRRVARGLGVVREACKVGTSRRLRQELECACVQRLAMVQGQRFLDHHSLKLVPKGDAIARRHNDPRGEALIELVDRVAGQRLEQRQVGAGPHHRERIEKRARHDT